MEDDMDLSGEEEEDEEDEDEEMMDEYLMDAPGINPITEVGEEKEIGKRGLKKKLVKVGEGWNTPDFGDEVEVHYTGTLLDGTKFASSRDRAAPFKFILGQGCQVIKGFDLGIKLMKKGENAIFTFPPELAYGESGFLPSIPPNATLQFDVELLSWFSIEDICKDGGVMKKILKEGEKWVNPKDPDEVLGFLCPALAIAVKTMKKGEKVLLTVNPPYGFGDKGRLASGDEGAVPSNAKLNIELELISWKTVTEIGDDKKIIKKILKEGEAYGRPNEGVAVKVKLIGKLQDGSVFLKRGHDEEEPFEFTTDEEQVIEGLDKAVMTMKNGEVALVTIPPEHAFGFTEPKQNLGVVPPNSTVIYEVELLSFVKETESWNMSTAEKIETAAKKKENGNALFKQGKYAKSSKRYEKGAALVEHDGSFTEEEKKQSKVMKVFCNLNNAACLLKLKDYRQAEKLCTKVLQLESSNVKALYRRAQAYTHLIDLDLAELDIKKALDLDPDNKELKLEYQKLKEKIKEYDKKDAEFYGKMFAKLRK
ncbi:putative peptidylprolyl isomerase [Dioscorea sansibarensis]